MEKNARNLLISKPCILYLLCFLLIQCKTISFTGDPLNLENSATKADQTTLNKISNTLNKLNNLGCGNVVSSEKSLGSIIDLNSSLFHCFRTSPHLIDTFRSVMNEITPLIDYKSDISYIQFFDQINTFRDSISFSIALDYLKDDSSIDPNFEGDPAIAGVNHYAYWKLIIPNIQSINNIPLADSELFKPYDRFNTMKPEEFKSI